MNTLEAIGARRTIRKFRQEPVPRDVLDKLVAAARLAPMGSNLQPMKYVVVDDPALVAEINKNVRWAGAIAPAGNPGPDEQPVAYVALVCDTRVRKTGNDVDAGAAGATILLAAVELGLGACWMGSVNRDVVAGLIRMPEWGQLHTVISLGYPAEDPVWEEMTGDSCKYYKDATGRLHVPKRPMAEILSHNTME